MLFFWDCSTAIRGAPRFFTGAPRLVTGAPRLVTGAARRVAGAAWRVAGAARRVASAARRVVGAARHVAGAPWRVAGAPTCFQPYHNHSQGAALQVMRDPGYSEGRPECPPRVWYSPEIDAPKFTLHILSDTPAGSQWLTYILLMWARKNVDFIMWWWDDVYLLQGLPSIHSRLLRPSPLSSPGQTEW